MCVCVCVWSLSVIPYKELQLHDWVSIIEMVLSDDYFTVYGTGCAKTRWCKVTVCQ